MAEFEIAFEKMIRNEGGYKLHNVSSDRGGQTYAGIARNFHSNWPGWRFIDANDLDNVALTQQVREFYRAQFWDKINGNEITIRASRKRFSILRSMPAIARLSSWPNWSWMPPRTGFWGLRPLKN